MLFDDLLHQRKAKARAETLGAEERLEDSRQDLAWDARARVFDDELEPIAHPCGADGDFSLTTGLGHRLSRVVNEVDDDPSHTLRIDRNLAIGAALARHDDVRRQALVGQHFVKPGIGRHDRAMQILHSRVVEQIIDDAVATLDAALDAAQGPLEVYAARGRGLLHGKERVANGGQRVAQFMRHGGRQLPERRQALLAYQLALRRFERRGSFIDAALQFDFGGDFGADVASGTAIAAEMSLRIEDRLAADADMNDLAVAQFPLEAEVLEGAPRREVGIVRGPLLLGYAELHGFVPSLAQILVAGDLRRVAAAGKAREAQILVLFPEPIRCRFGEVAETRFAVGDLHLGRFGFLGFAIVVEREQKSEGRQNHEYRAGQLDRLFQAVVQESAHRHVDRESAHDVVEMPSRLASLELVVAIDAGLRARRRGKDGAEDRLAADR